MNPKPTTIKDIPLKEYEQIVTGFLMAHQDYLQIGGPGGVYFPVFIGDCLIEFYDKHKGTNNC